MSATTATNQKPQSERVQKSKKQVLHNELWQLDLQIIDFQRKLSLSDKMEEMAVIELATARSLVAKALNHLAN